MFGPSTSKPIVMPPTFHGQHGKAWRLDLPACRVNRNLDPTKDGTLGMWIVEAPWAHPCWNSYRITVTHLRPLPDQIETKFYLEGATHEMWVDAIDPDFDRNEGLLTANIRVLQPTNFAAQFVMPNDDDAVLRVEAAARRIVHGMLSPDTDYIRHWAHLFGDNMLKKGAGETKIMLSDGKGAGLEIVIPPKPGPQDLN